LKTQNAGFNSLINYILRGTHIVDGEDEDKTKNTKWLIIRGQ